ncbi:helix-turn-helix domain-containing protein [Candidatus Bathyarchaeota archaeon]|nr:helix-turn-helix domain-containing protein [Candidatus Bathyarchaeota archaeon]
MSRIRKGFSNQVFQVLSSPIRFEVLRLLRLNRTLTYSEIMDRLGLEPTRHAGKFAYHLRSLIKARLIEKTDDGKTYRLTDLGIRVLEFAQELNEYLLKKAGKLLVRSSRMAIEEFDRFRIVSSLVKEAQVPLDLAESISLEVERRLVNLQVKYLTAPLIREIVNAVLIEKGLEEYRHRLTRLGLPVYDVIKTFEKASMMKMHVEDVRGIAGEAVLREYTLLNVLPRDVADAYLSGDIHLELLGSWILRPDIIQHDIRLILAGKFPSLPSKSPATLTSALNRLRIAAYNSSFEVNLDQGFDMFNVFLAPFIRGKRAVEVKRALQMFIESLRIPSTLNVNFGLEIGLNQTMENLKTPSGGEVYGDYQDEVLTFTQAFIDVLKKGFSRIPLCNLNLIVKIRESSLKGEWVELMKNLHDAMKLGIPIIVANLTDVNDNISFSSCGFKFEPFSEWEVETLAVPMIADVSINMPRLAQISKGNDERLWENLQKTMDKAIEAIRIRRGALENRIKEGLLPTISQPDDPYIRFKAIFSSLGLIGLNEATIIHTGADLLNASSQATMLKTLRRIRSYLDAGRDRIGLTSICGEEGSSRLVNLDLNNYGKSILNSQGFRREPYYTDVCIVPLEYNIPLSKRLEIEEKAGSIMNYGTLPVIEVNSNEVDCEMLFKTTLYILSKHKQLRCFTYSTFTTYCKRCSKVFESYWDRCPKCQNIATVIQYGRTPPLVKPIYRWTVEKRANMPFRKTYGVKDFEPLISILSSA